METLKDYKTKAHFVFTLSFIMILISCVKSDILKEYCYEADNFTWTCNFIPTVVPEHYIHIRVVDFKRNDTSVKLNSSSFAEESWSNVQTLMFNDTTGLNLQCTFLPGCFKELKSLKELRIHMSFFVFERGVFQGLPLVHTLDLSRCYRLFLDNLTEQLNVPDTLPNLQTLILSELGSYVKRNNLNETFVKSLLPRNITYVDVSKTQISFANLTAIFKYMKALENINVSYSSIADTWNNDITQEDMSHVKVVDMSHASLPAKVIPLFPGKYVVANQTTNYSEVRNLDELKTIFTPLVFNMSGILPEPSSVWIYNCSATIDEDLQWNVKTLSISKNNIKYIDAVVRCPIFKFSSLVGLDLSDNGLQMLQPTSCAPNLERVDLSKNNLFMMLQKEPGLFVELVSSQTKLRYINLANNQLSKIPSNFFKNCKNLETIDLSFNKLDQLHLDLIHLPRLHVLDVSHNNIKVLDEVSINNVKGIPCAESIMSTENQFSVDFTSNPIRCSTCDTKHFIEWLVNSRKVDVKRQGLSCTSEDGSNVSVDESVVRQVQSICIRNTITIISIVSTCGIVLTITITLSFVYRRKIIIKRQRNRENVINLLIEGEGRYEFVAFLSYSSSDGHFVEENVINQLNENLQLMTGINRLLICTGDQHLRPGFYVHNEIISCLDRASVIIIVVSNNFCRSEYCQNEFDQAYIQRKPIVLMFSENVDEDLMMPALRQLYRRNVRILWQFENGQFVLRTTWENVCKSILDKIQG